MVTKGSFDGYDEYTISSESLSVSVITLGATTVSIKLEGRELLLNYQTAQGYIDGTAYIGATVGRYANRIGGAAFTLNGREYTLVKNEAGNQLHGGPHSYDKRRWNAEILGDYSVSFALLSPDGDNGYPGNFKASVKYTVVGSDLRLDFGGESDKDTVCCLTSHMYFRLGESSLDTLMQINADSYVEVGAGLIPTGRLLKTEGDFDFSSPRRTGKNFDHAFVLSSEKALSVRGGGVELTLSTDYPAVQYYTGEFLGAPFNNNGGFAIEPEFFPDSPNHPEFPSATLKAGESFHKYALYSFKTV